MDRAIAVAAGVFPSRLQASTSIAALPWTVNARWQAGMAQYFADPDGARPDEAMRPLTEYFHLD